MSSCGFGMNWAYLRPPGQYLQVLHVYKFVIGTANFKGGDIGNEASGTASTSTSTGT